MKNSSISDFVAKTMHDIVQSENHKRLFGLKTASKEKCAKCGKDDCKCGDVMNAEDKTVVMPPLVVNPKAPKGSEVSDALKADDENDARKKAKKKEDEEKEDEDKAHDGRSLDELVHSHTFKELFPEAAAFLADKEFPAGDIDEKYPSAAQVLDEEGALETAAFDVAIEGLLTASGALDNVGMEKAATLSLKLASLVVEAKKSEKDKIKEQKEKDKAKKLKEKEKLDEAKAKDKMKKEKEKEKAEKEKAKAKEDAQKAKDKAAKEKEMAKLKAEKEKAKKDKK